MLTVIMQFEKYKSVWFNIVSLFSAESYAWVSDTLWFYM